MQHNKNLPATELPTTEMTLEVFFDSLGATHKSFVSSPDYDATIDDLE